MNFENDDTYKMLVTERKRVELLSDAAFVKVAEAVLLSSGKISSTSSEEEIYEALWILTGVGIKMQDVQVPAFEKVAEVALRQARRDVTTLSGYFPARIA